MLLGEVVEAAEAIPKETCKGFDGGIVDMNVNMCHVDLFIKSLDPAFSFSQAPYICVRFVTLASIATS